MKTTIWMSLRMMWRKRLILVVMLIVLLTGPFAFAESPTTFLVEILVEKRPVLLGDVFFARVVFKNAGLDPIFVQSPIAGVTYTIKAGRTESPGQFESRNILVTEFLVENTFVDKRELKPDQTFSEVCMIRAVANSSSEVYPGWNPCILEFDSNVEFGKGNPLAMPLQSKVRRIRRGLTIQIPYAGLGVNHYAQFRDLHGGPAFGGGWENGLLATDTLSRDVSKWREVRAWLHPDANLLRLIEFIENYQAVLKSDATDERKFDLAVALLNDRRPMERDWLRPRLRNQLANDLSDVFYKRQQEFQQGL